jgi:DNA-binding NarL/FixJ family response regulator
LAAILALQNDLNLVGEAQDGEEACLLYKQLCPDILILDLRMPKKDGLQVLAELMPQRPRPRVIVLTNSAKSEDLRQALTRLSLLAWIFIYFRGSVAREAA